MKSGLESFEEVTAAPMITPGDVMEYCFCPRFVYYMHCLKIPQHENRRYKVIMGREIHKRRLARNRRYLRKKIGCIAKQENVYLASAKLKVRGRVDEVLTLQDESLAPLDYKYAQYNNHVYKTLRIQTLLYAALIKETYRKPVRRGYICFIRSSNKLVSVPVREEDLMEVRQTVDKVFAIIYREFYPRKTKSRRKCLDCTYKNICV